MMSWLVELVGSFLFLMSYLLPANLIMLVTSTIGFVCNGLPR
jgi:hypothetical protein